MVETSMNIFDLIVLVVVGMSALMSFFRGFAREVLSLGAWVAASIITLYSFPTVSEWIRPQVGSEGVASGLASMGVFFVSLLSLKILTGTMVKYIKPGSEVGSIDNMIGLMFGVARGILIVSVGYFAMTLVLNESNYPEYVKQAKSRPYVEKSAAWVAKVAPDYISALTLNSTERKEQTQEAKQKAHERAEKLRRSTDDMPSFEDLQRRIRDENNRN